MASWRSFFFYYPPLPEQLIILGVVRSNDVNRLLCSRLALASTTVIENEIRLLTFHSQAFKTHFVVTLAILAFKTKNVKTSYCSYARPAQPGPNRTRLCGPCIAAIAGD